MNTFVQLSVEEEESRRMSMKAYGFWRWNGLSPELALALSKQHRVIREIYEIKKAVDNANSGEITHVIGLKK